jgi:hypothetical protein
MAASAAASKLTEAHRLAQARLGADTVRATLDAWRLIDAASVDATSAQFLRLVSKIVASQRRVSATLAGDYLTAFRSVELGGVAGFHLAPSVPADPVAVTSSLTATGPAGFKARLRRGLPAPTASELAGAVVARAAMRIVLNGGRQRIVDTVDQDRRAHGWARVTSGKPCAFCAMLASRGPVYTSAAGFPAHDSCACTAEPVYHRDAAWPPGAARYAAMWDEVTAGLSGDDARRAFRRAIDAAK